MLPFVVKASPNPAETYRKLKKVNLVIADKLVFNRNIILL